LSQIIILKGLNVLRLEWKWYIFTYYYYYLVIIK